ncbi:GTPase Era [Candidatus Finniella inopinata]|uniref:GTPase Era n=2 Tax=Candidatus Finniella inopinata TaxID=1696036 RepID=A0A4Q7DJG4_9PROT|nr:GTPase Era [Candidatus Finniella inopinata]
MNDAAKRCGFIAVLGQPNAGKSTLVNAFVGSKVSIVSPKVQTTRRRILGLTIHEQTQLIFVDTPGIFTPKRSLEKSMVKTALEARQGADKVLLIVDARQKSFEASFAVLKQLGEHQSIVLVLNKIDLIDRQRLLAIIQKFQAFPQISDTFMISALTGEGVSDLLQWLAVRMPQSPWLYPEDQMTDLPLRLWAAEITREQLVLQLEHELPYETYVETETWENFENGSVKIQQAVVVARLAQKGIILGRQGQRIKAISQRARIEMEKHLGHPVHLFLFVKVTDDWMDKPHLLREAGILDS